jgi:hypothetical protein
LLDLLAVPTRGSQAIPALAPSPPAATLLQQCTRAVASLLESETVPSAVPRIAVEELVVYCAFPRQTSIEEESWRRARSSLQ